MHMAQSFQVSQTAKTLFGGLGRMSCGDYRIQLREDAVPFALSTPRRVLSCTGHIYKTRSSFATFTSEPKIQEQPTSPRPIR